MNEWCEFDRLNPSPELVNHKVYQIKLKDSDKILAAKWHDEPDYGGRWEAKTKFEGRPWIKFWIGRDPTNPVIAWRDIPEPKTPLEFTDKQLWRIDEIQSAAISFFEVLNSSEDMAYELEDIWSLIYHGCELMHKRGLKVNLPTHVTKPDGIEYITDWYEEEEDADMDH